VVLKLIGDPFGGATEVVVAGSEEFRDFFRVFGERCDQQAFLREMEIIGGAQALSCDVLCLPLRRIGGRGVIPVARIVMHSRANPTVHVGNLLTRNRLIQAAGIRDNLIDRSKIFLTHADQLIQGYGAWALNPRTAPVTSTTHIASLPGFVRPITMAASRRS
jgi:hypothetical protein